MSPPPSELLELIKQSYAKDPFFKFSGKEKEALRYRDGLFLRQNKDQILVPLDDGNAFRKRVISSHHDLPYAGHLGRDRTLELIQRHFFWPKMRADVEESVSSCDNCQRNKASNQKPNGLLQPLQVPEGLWTSVSMDLITHLPETKHGNTAIVVS